jgi:glycosyltransferase involved in cell wall biosynthesis
MVHISSIRLSICIATLNRGDYIGETLSALLAQIEDDVELVIVDGGSKDNTSDIVGFFCSKHPQIKYFKELNNSGVDRDYDKAVSYARGLYCWLMTDDDLPVPGAINRILSALDGDTDLVIVNAEIKNADLSKVIVPLLINQIEDRRYGAGEESALFTDAGNGLSFIGSVIIKREVWLSRDRSLYYGSLFIHVGVIFQNPPINKVFLIGKPLIQIRYGNAMWTTRGFEVWMFKWPQLIWSFTGFSVQAKTAVCKQKPWQSAKRLMFSRAAGSYSLLEFKKFLKGRSSLSIEIMQLLIAIVPGRLINALIAVYISMFHRAGLGGMYDLTRSVHTNWITQLAARFIDEKTS